MAITPGRYQDSESFKQPTVVHGAVTLVPGLVVSDDDIRQPGVERVFERHPRNTPSKNGCTL